MIFTEVLYFMDIGSSLNLATPNTSIDIKRFSEKSWRVRVYVENPEISECQNPLPERYFRQAGLAANFAQKYL